MADVAAPYALISFLAVPSRLKIPVPTFVAYLTLVRTYNRWQCGCRRVSIESFAILGSKSYKRLH